MKNNYIHIMSSNLISKQVNGAIGDLNSEKKNQIYKWRLLEDLELCQRISEYIFL